MSTTNHTTHDQHCKHAVQRCVYDVFYVHMPTCTGLVNHCDESWGFWYLQLLCVKSVLFLFIRVRRGVLVATNTG